MATQPSPSTPAGNSTRTLGLAYAGAALVVFVVYLPTLLFYFVGGDNFDEIGQARFRDSKDPSAIFTTTLGGYRYRPLDRATNLLTYKLGGFDPQLFRIRNLAVHIATALLFGHILASLLNVRSIGPVGALLFGLHPGNHLTVTLAITTKTLYGFFFLLTCLVWLLVWRRKQPSVISWLALLLLTLITISFHEQGVGLLGLAVIMTALLCASNLKRALRWIVYGGSLAAASTGAFLLIRSAANVPAIEPALGSTLRYGVAAVISVFSPVDFLMLFGVSVVTGAQKSIAVLADPGAYVPQIGALLVGLVLVAGLLVWSLATHIRSGNRQAVVRFGVLLIGMLLSLVPIILVLRTAYNEVYNYVPVAFTLAMIIGALTPACYSHAPSPRLARVMLVALALPAFSYGAATIYRNSVLGSVAGETQQVVADITSLVPNPESNALFLMLNQPGLETDSGYSIYGFRGAGTLEDAVTYAVRLLYNREDLTGKLVRNPAQLPSECASAGGDRKVYVLEWRDGGLRRLENACP